MESKCNCFSPPIDNPVKKYRCQENLKMFETLATLQVGIFIVLNPFWFTVVTPIVITWIMLKINCIYNMCAKVVFIIDFELILRLI